MIYTVTYNPAIDYVIHTAGALKIGEVNRSESETAQFGGKGINVSAVLKALGHESVALGFAAGYTGKWLEEYLKDSGLKTDFIQLKRGMTRINVKIRAGVETEINGAGAQIDDAALETLYKKLDVLKNGDVLVLSGSIPRGCAASEYAGIMERLYMRGVVTVVDATRNLLTNTLEHHPFLIKPNKAELGDIFNKTLTSDADVIDCAKKLQQRGAQNVLVSMGADGAILLDTDGKTHKAPAVQGSVINSVASGDSMVAGFIAGWLEKKDLDYALKLGTAAGAATAFSIGLADKETVDGIMETL